MKTPRVLIVEDDAEIEQLLTVSLGRAGMRSNSVATAGAAVAAVRRYRPDLVLLDLLLPDGSGNDVCRALKGDPETRAIPVIVVTALGGEVDRVVGLELGADDYVVKPFSVRELVLRVRAVLRRCAAAPPDAGSITVGRLTLDVPARRAFVDHAEVALTHLEYRLLLVLVQRAGRIQERGALFAEVWGQPPTEFGRTLDTHVTRLRRKLGAAAGYVHSVRGVGYRFTVDPEG